MRLVGDIPFGKQRADGQIKRRKRREALKWVVVGRLLAVRMGFKELDLLLDQLRIEFVTNVSHSSMLFRSEKLSGATDLEVTESQ